MAIGLAQLQGPLQLPRPQGQQQLLPLQGLLGQGPKVGPHGGSSGGNQRTLQAQQWLLHRSTGVLDGGVITWELAPSLKLNELAPTHTDVAGEESLYNLFLVWGMNQSKYDALPDDLKAVIDANSGFYTSAWSGRAHDIGDAEGRAKMEEAGNLITQMSPEATAEIHALGDEVIADWVVEMTGKGLNAEALLSDARAAVQVTRDIEGSRDY